MRLVSVPEFLGWGPVEGGSRHWYCSAMRAYQAGQNCAVFSARLPDLLGHRFELRHLSPQPHDLIVEVELRLLDTNLYRAAAGWFRRGAKQWLAAAQASPAVKEGSKGKISGALTRLDTVQWGAEMGRGRGTGGEEGAREGWEFGSGASATAQVPGAGMPEARDRSSRAHFTNRVGVEKETQRRKQGADRAGHRK